MSPRPGGGLTGLVFRAIMFVITDLVRPGRLAGAGGRPEEDRVALWQLFTGG